MNYKTETERMLRQAYERQLHGIGEILVRAKILKSKEIRRQGVMFAVRDRFEPMKNARPL